MSKGFKTKKKITYNAGTYRISIPKMFVENMGLEAGSEVHLIYENEDTLTIKKISEDNVRD